MSDVTCTPSVGVRASLLHSYEFRHLRCRPQIARLALQCWSKLSAKEERTQHMTTGKKKLSELVRSAVDSDSLLAEAVERLKREKETDSVEFFRHGQFGSHNA